MSASGLARGNGDWYGTAGGIATIVDGRAGIAGRIQDVAAGTDRPVNCGFIAPGLSVEVLLPVHSGESVRPLKGRWASGA